MTRLREFTGLLEGCFVKPPFLLIFFSPSPGQNKSKIEPAPVESLQNYAYKREMDAPR
jgi:hypothetical protein